MIILLACLMIIVIAFCGAPIFVVILAAAMLGFWQTDIPLTAIPVELFRIADTPMLVALPMFSLAGYLLAESRSSHRLVQVTQAMFGALPGGLAVIALITCALFTALTGASGVTIVAVGALLYPALQQVGYSERYSLGLVTAAGSLGLLLAPSLPLILYGIIAQQMGVGESFTLQQLFAAGVLPAVLMIVALALWNLWANRHAPIARQPFHWATLRDALIDAKWEVPLPFIVLGGIYGGYFALSEAAAVTLAYVFITQVMVYREIPLHKLPSIVISAMTMVGGIILILSVSLAFTNVLIDAEIPTRLFALVNRHIDNRFTFFIALNVFLLALGCILDIFSAIVIMVPLLLPLAAQYGIHPIHLGIVFLANMQIGYLTPPVGMNLFIASYRFNKSITELYRVTLPFMAILLLTVLLITYVPWLSLVFVQ